MLFQRITLAALAALAALVLAGHAGAADAPIRVILVGDSTMATKSGYGDALCARFTQDVTCVNLARGGRSSASFRAEGRWDEPAVAPMSWPALNAVMKR